MAEKTLKDFRIVFFGTPDFASYQLEYLVESGCNVVAVVTTPDRKKGRGGKQTPCAVKESALKLNIPTLEPENLKAPEFIDQLKKYKADVQVIVAFRMLPKIVWDMPEYGTINLHGSYLPNYRGAAPINWCLINGDTSTGVSTFVLKHEIDSGDVLLRQETEILDDDDFGSLYHKLKEIGAPLLLESLHEYLINHQKPIPQAQLEEAKSKEAPKIFKDDCKIDWSKTAKSVQNLVRGLSPLPGAMTFLKEKPDGKLLFFKIFKCTIMESKCAEQPGQFIINANKEWLVQCADHTLRLDLVQFEGKKRMKCSDLLNGIQIDSYLSEFQ